MLMHGMKIHHHRRMHTIDSRSFQPYDFLSMVTDDTAPLTKADGRHILELLTTLMEERVVKKDLLDLEERLHQEMANMEERLLRHINFLDERNRKDYFDMLDIRYDQHDLRIVRLEQHTGIASR